MLFRTTAAILAALSLTAASLPAHASDPDNVMILANAITATGTTLYTSCPDHVEFQGAYVSSKRVLAVCADTATGTPTAFGPEEQDTLRHEGIHLAQDCMDKSFNNELETTRNLYDVMRMMAAASNTYDFEAIEKQYRSMGADDETVMLEFEAWSGAAIMSNAEVASLIRRACRV